MAATTLVKAPLSSSINTAVSPCPTGQLIRDYGPPRDPRRVGQDCQQPSSPWWRERMATEDVGPFRVTGHRLFLAALRRGFARLKVSSPDVYARLGTAGGLCVRWVRGTTGSWSNHSLGLAVDLTLDGRLDRRGDGLVQQGLLDVYAALKRERLFWGCEFRIEDSMHFEASRELVREWIASGEF